MVKISELNKDWYTPGDVADMIGVVPMTVIGYDNKGIMKFERTPTNRRIISKNNLIESLHNLKILVDDYCNSRYDALYARVSTQAQSKRGDLDTQINTLLAYCATQNPINIQIYKDVGSGLNDKRKGLTKLIQDIENNQINRLFITYKDRLTRFGFNYLFEICRAHNTDIIQISNEVITKSTQEELAEDLCAIIHSFSGKLYGLRKSQIKDINDKLSSLKEVNENDTG